MRKGRIAVRTLYDSGQQRRFMERQVRNVFAEIGTRRLAESGDRKSSALAKVDLVAVHRHDVLFAQSLFEDDGHVDFGEFSLPGTVRVEEEVLDELLRDRTAAFF